MSDSRDNETSIGGGGGDGSVMENPFGNIYVVIFTVGMTLVGLLVPFLQWLHSARRTPHDRGWSAGMAAWSGYALSTAYISKELFNGMPCWMMIIVVLVMMGMVVIPYFGLTLKMWVRHPRNPGKVRFGYQTVHKYARGNPDAFFNWFSLLMLILQGVLVVSIMASKVDSPYNLGVLAQECDMSGDLWVIIVNFVFYVLLGLYMTVMLYDTHTRPYLLLLHEQSLVLLGGFTLVTAYLALAAKATSFEQWLRPDTLLYVFSMLPSLVSLAPTVLAIVLLKLARVCCPSSMGLDSPETLGQLFTFYDRSRVPVLKDHDIEISIGDLEDEEDYDDTRDLNVFSASTGASDDDRESKRKMIGGDTRRPYRKVEPGLFEVKERIPLLVYGDNEIIPAFEKIAADIDSHVMGIRAFSEVLGRLRADVNEGGGVVFARHNEELARILARYTTSIHRPLF